MCKLQRVTLTMAVLPAVGAAAIAVAAAAAVVQAPDTDATTSLEPAQGLAFELVGKLAGQANALDVAGEVAYVGAGPTLIVLGVADPRAIEIIGRSAPLPETIEGVAVSNGYAYVADGLAGLRVLEVSDPHRPREIGVYELASPASAEYVIVDGAVLYLAAGDLGLLLLDVSQPSSPHEIGRIDTPGSASHLWMEEDLAFVADWDGGLQVIDLSDPSAPRAVGALELPGPAKRVTVQGNHAYVVEGNPPDVLGNPGVRVIDVSDPSSPVDVAFVFLGSEQVEAVVTGDYLVVAGLFGPVTSLDISQPESPRQVRQIRIPGNTKQGVLADGKWYLAQARGIRIVNLSDPAYPGDAGHRTLTGLAGGLAVGEGDASDSVYAYIAESDFADEEWRGMRVVDVSDPELPIEVARPKTSWVGDGIESWFEIIGITLSGRFAYNVSGDLHVFDVSEPREPVLVSHLEDVGRHALAVADGMAYVTQPSGCSFHGGIQFVDVSDAAKPQLEGLACLQYGIVRDVAVKGLFAYVAADGAGLRAVTIHDPVRPYDLGGGDTPGSALWLSIDGQYAYVADGQAGLEVVDITVATRQKLVGFVPAIASVEFVDIDGDLTYVIDVSRDAQGREVLQTYVRAIDISDPTAPREVARYETPNVAYRLSAHDGLVYVTDDVVGLTVLRLVEAASPTPSATTAPSATTTPGSSPSPSATASPSGTPATAVRPTASVTATATGSVTATATGSVTATATGSVTATATGTVVYATSVFLPSLQRSQ